MVPKGWKQGHVQDFFFLQRGFDITEKYSCPGNIPVYSSSGVAYFHNEAKVKGPGIVTGRKGSVGSVYLIKEDFWPHDTTLWVKDFKGNYVEYIQYFLIFLRLERFDEASSVPTLNRKNVHAVKCIFPPIAEQVRIVQILSTWDKAITTTEKLLANSEQQKKALMQQLLTGKKRFVEIEKWQHSPLKKLVRISKGKQLNRSTLKEVGKYPVINGGITPSGYSEMANQSGDTITISEGGNSCGYVSFQKSNFWCGGHCYALCDLELTTQITYQLLKFNENKIMKLRVGSGLPNIQKKDLEHLIIYYPADPVEQQKISSTLFTADEEIRILKDKIKYLKEEKKALMQQLLTGKRRVRV